MKNYRSTLALMGTLAVGCFVASGATAATRDCLTLERNVLFGTTDKVAQGTVSKLQDFLRGEGHLDHVSTGYFGHLTLDAVKRFQGAHGIDSIGTVGPKTRAAIKTASCEAPFATSTGGQTIVSSELAIQPMSGSSILTTAAAPAASAPTLTLPYNASSFTDWRGTWGSISATPSNTLLLKALPETAGAEAIVPMSAAWSDYRYTANLTTSNGDVTLISRYVDENNFYACNFTRNEVAILERKNGVSQVVVAAAVEGAPREAYFFRNMTVSMRVQGPTVGCTMVGSADNVTHTFTDPNRKGGIGIQTWNQYPGNATVDLRSVRVEQL